jgi:hypothetical protein
MKKLVKWLFGTRNKQLDIPVVRQRKTSFDLIIIRNTDLSYTAKIKMNNRKWFQKKIFGIYYVPDWLRPLKNQNDLYYITIASFGGGQTSIYFNVMLNMFIDFKKQYNITEKCGVAIYAA